MLRVPVFKKHTLFLSLLIHLLLLASALIVWQPALNLEKPPSMYVPSYTAQEPPAPNTPAPALEKAEQKPQPEKPVKKTDPLAAQEKIVKADPTAIPLSKSMQVQRATNTKTNTSAKVTDAIHLIGDKNTVPQPLIKILGRALSAKLVYPKIAIDFRLRGTAYVGFMLHPDGTVTDVEVVKSSQAGVLDNEAAAAVRAISPLKGVSEYVEKTKPMVVGIIFN
jgi:periplasmic protein TonB